jgi:hypothetical protein
MRSIAKNILSKVFPKFTLSLRAINSLVINDNSYLYSTGWMRSKREGKPVNEDGREVPWMNYPVIRFLEDRFRKDFQLFEFGSGYSTLFYARLVQRVTSLEHDEEWLRAVRKIVPENVTLIFWEQDINGEYCQVINSTGQKYDVVIVDGIDRVKCIKQSIEALTSRGVILLDDSQREDYREGIDYAKEKGFRALDFEGLKPTGHEVSRATIFYCRDNCFDI